MTDVMVKIIVEVLDILATATKEMKQSRASEFALPPTSHEAHMSFRNFFEEGSRSDKARRWDEEA